MQTIAPGCALEVQRGPDWLLVRIENLDFLDSDTPPLASHLWSLLQQHFTHRLVLELDGVHMLSSYLIGQLIDLNRRIERHNGVMHLCGLSPHNREVLHDCRLDERFLLYEDRQEAVMGCSHAQKPR